ncbi:hypothetical protein [Geobacter pickeringii]|uniref:hypothetical protein n=1 Tax=Geobacter pickeringii TaxID=345632 RepID=UPI000ACBD745|nr:hypothetical protein [Geobacter pickeringii]
MKALLTFLAVSLINGAFLYPLFYLGVGKEVSWLLVAAQATGGVFCLYLLVRHRKRW